MHRHNKASIGAFDALGARFHHDHTAWSVPFPRYEGTVSSICVDRFTWWYEGMNLADRHKETVALTFGVNFTAKVADITNVQRGGLTAR